MNRSLLTIKNYSVRKIVSKLSSNFITSSTAHIIPTLYPNSLHPNKFYDTSSHDSTVIALHSSAIPYSQYSWCEWRRVIGWLRVWLPPSAPPFVDRVRGRGQSTSLLPLWRVIGVSSMANSGIDEHRNGATLLTQRGQDRGGKKSVKSHDRRDKRNTFRKKSVEASTPRCLFDLSFLCN